MITGEQPVDVGNIEIGETIVLGVYNQMGLQDIDKDQTCMEFVTEKVYEAQGPASSSVSMSDTPNQVRKLLNQFEFPSARWNERVSMLSGGEKRRLQLLEVLTKVSFWWVQGVWFHDSFTFPCQKRKRY